MICQISEKYEGIYKIECLIARNLHSNWGSSTYIQEKRTNKISEDWSEQGPTFFKFDLI